MPLKLESFGSDNPPSVVAPGPEPTDEARLSAYDDGYSAGWEDALAARDDEVARLRDAVGQNLQTLGFTYHEARAHVLQSLRLLLEAMVEQLLPRLAAEAMPPIVAEVVMKLAADCAERPVILRLHPQARTAVESFLTPHASLPMDLSEDTSLSPGQVILQAGSAGARIDLDGAIAEIGSALAAFYDLLPAERRYG